MLMIIIDDDDGDDTAAAAAPTERMTLLTHTRTHMNTASAHTIALMLFELVRRRRRQVRVHVWIFC